MFDDGNYISGAPGTRAANGREAMTTTKCFLLLALTALGGAALGSGLCITMANVEPDLRVWLVVSAGVALLGVVAIETLLLHRLVLTPQLLAAQAATAGQAVAAARLESHRRLRHDIRGALSPALLTADRLLTHADPAVQRAGDIMVRAVERAAALLTDPPPPGITPPDRS